MIDSPGPSTHRLETLDVVRGFALLGILGPNIVAFAWPDTAMYTYEVLTRSRALLGLEPADEQANMIGELIVWEFFFGKMMFLFATLFGAGAILYSRKFDREGAPLSAGAGLWYRRMAWLLVIGLVHAVFLWFGDILVFYAAAGLGAVWWVRRWRPLTLVLVAAVVYLGATLVMGAIMGLGVWAHETGQQDMFAPLAEQLAAYRGGYLDAMEARLWSLLFMYLFVLPLFFFWTASAMMMFGMALMKTGILAGERPTGFYLRVAAIGIPLGLATTALTIWAMHAVATEVPGFLFMAVGQLVGIPTALGYAAVLIALVKTGRLKWLTGAFAAVGRMALSNYLLQSLICTTFFYGWGLGYFATFDYPAMGLFVLGVWVINIVFSAVWLRFFRFGPAEWVWRCLTYWRVFPMRREALIR